MKRFAAYQLPLILYAALIFVVSSISKLPTPDLGITFFDKIAHFFEYFIFFFLAFRALSSLTFSKRGFWLYFTAVVFSILFAALDEYHQSFVPGRRADFWDLISDSLGIILGSILHFLLHKRRHVTSKVI